MWKSPAPSSTEDCSDCSSEVKCLVATKIQLDLDPHEVLFGNSSLNNCFAKCNGLGMGSSSSNLHSATLANALLLPDVVKKPGGDSLLASRGHSINHLNINVKL